MVFPMEYEVFRRKLPLRPIQSLQMSPSQGKGVPCGRAHMRPSRAICLQKKYQESSGPSMMELAPSPRIKSCPPSKRHSATVVPPKQSSDSALKYHLKRVTSSLFIVSIWACDFDYANADAHRHLRGYIYILYVTCTLIIMVHAQTIHMELWNMDIVTIIVETYWKHKGLLYIYI